MLAALIEGERDPKVLAGFAQGRMRPKIPDLQRALVGYFSDHHARLCRRMLDHIDSLTATITELTADIDTAIAPFTKLGAG
jgi:transposase